MGRFWLKSARSRLALVKMTFEGREGAVERTTVPTPSGLVTLSSSGGINSSLSHPRPEVHGLGRSSIIHFANMIMKFRFATYVSTVSCLGASVACFVCLLAGCRDGSMEDFAIMTVSRATLISTRC